MMSAVAAKVLATIGIATAGMVAAAHSGTVPPGIVQALQHVPTWTHAHTVLESLQQAFSSGTHPRPPVPTH